jgi:HEAT repeat protein
VIDPRVRQFAEGRHATLSDALSGFAVRGDRPVLEDVLLEHARDAQGRSNDRVAFALDDGGWIGRWLDGLASGSWWTRAESAEKLGRSGVARAVPALSKAMEDPVPEVRLRAAQALGQLGTGPALRPLIDALCEPNRWSAIRVAEILTARGEEVADEIEAAFERLTPRGKLAALDVAANLRAGRAVPWLERLLRDTEADVRARAAHALGAIGEPASGPALTRALSDDAWPVRAMAARAIGRVRHEPAIDALCAALRDREWWVRRNAATALRALGPVGLDALRRMLADPDNFARHQAIVMLEEARVVDDDVAHLASGGESRERAVALVRALVGAGQLGRLRVLREQHPDARVRAALAGLVPVESDTEREEARR